MKVFIAAYRGVGFGGRFIKWFTFGDFSHVSLVFQPEKGEAVEIESIQGEGVRRRAFDFDPRRVALFRVPCTNEQALKVFDVARKLIGCKYDWSGIYGFIRRRKKENPNKWFCSELVAHCLNKAGIQLHRLPAWKQSPVMVCASIKLIPTSLKPFVLNDLEEGDFAGFLQPSRAQEVTDKNRDTLCRPSALAAQPGRKKRKKSFRLKSCLNLRETPGFLTFTDNVA